VTSTRGQLLASTVPGQAPQPVPTLTLLGAQAQWQITPVLELGVGVDNLTDTRLSDLSKNGEVSDAEIATGFGAN
jgi:outer membrane receptor for ferrienterochelin and colicins